MGHSDDNEARVKRFIWCVMIMLNWCVDAAAADDACINMQKAVLRFMAMKKPRNVAQVHTHCLTPIARIVRANADAAKIRAVACVRL